MNFHSKAVLAFLAFHVIVTGGGLILDQVPQVLGQGANDNVAQLVGAVLWAVWCLTLSVGALGMVYLGRAAWKLGRGSWWWGGVAEMDGRLITPPMRNNHKISMPLRRAVSSVTNTRQCPSSCRGHHALGSWTEPHKNYK